MARAPALAAIAAAALLAVPAAAEVASPLPWHDPGPIGRLFLQPAFEAPEVIAAGDASLDLRLLYSNSMLAERAGSAAVEVDVETAQLTPTLRWGAAPGLELQAGLPLLLDYGGFLDGPIDAVEGWLGVPNPERRSRPRGAVAYRLVTQGGRFERSGAAAGLGDAWVAGKLVVLRPTGARPAVSVRALVKLPTGRAALGSRQLDVGASVHVGWTLARWAVRLQLDLAAPTGDLAWAGLSTRPYAGGEAGVAWQVNEGVAVHLQASGHSSPVTGTGLRAVDRGTAYLVAGASLRLGRAATLDLALAENLFAPENQGADVTLLAAVRAPL